MAMDKGTAMADSDRFRSIQAFQNVNERKCAT